MIKFFKDFIQSIIKLFGFKVSRLDTNFKYDNRFKILLKEVKPFTMTSDDRIHNLYLSINYILKNEILGDFVECGVWKGGSMMLAAKILKKNKSKRMLFLYDTFEGMTKPDFNDFTLESNNGKKKNAETLLKKNKDLMCIANIDEVKKNLNSTGYPNEYINFIKGDVKQTLSRNSPDKIALLRLDTDWYESTKIELDLLFPKLTQGGVLIIDDYKSWEGCKKAVDDYFKDKKNIYFHSIDDQAILGIKLY